MSRNCLPHTPTPLHCCRTACMTASGSCKRSFRSQECNPYETLCAPNCIPRQDKSHRPHHHPARCDSLDENDASTYHYACASSETESGGSCSAGGTCGDGSLAYSEYCDSGRTGAENCCVSCSSWDLEVDECKLYFPFIDAGFLDSSSQMYLFSQDIYSVYAGYDDTYTISGYPKNISSLLGGTWSSLTGWHSGIDAAMALPNSYVYLFKDDEVIKADLGTSTILDGYPADIENEFSLNSQAVAPDESGEFRRCMLANGLDMALAITSSEGYLICQGTLLAFPTSAPTERVEYRLNDKLLIEDWNTWTDYDSLFHAAIRLPTGSIRIYVAEGNFVWSGSAIEEGLQPTTSIYLSDSEEITGIIAATTCQIANCFICPTADICLTCKEGYNFYGGLCFAETILSALSFDDSTRDAAFLRDDVTLTYSTDTYSSSDGDQSWDIQPTDKVYLLQVNFLTYDWKVTFYWKPDNTSPAKFLTLMRDRGSGVEEEFSITLNQDYDTTLQQSTHFINVYGDTLDLTGGIVTVGEWNKLSFEFHEGEVRWTINSNSEIAEAFAGASGLGDTQVTFTNWWIGADSSGMHGLLDEFRVESTDSALEDIPFIVIIVLGLLAFFAMGCFCLCTRHCIMHGKEYFGLQWQDLYRDQLIQAPAETIVKRAETIVKGGHLGSVADIFKSSDTLRVVPPTIPGLRKGPPPTPKHRRKINSPPGGRKKRGTRAQGLPPRQNKTLPGKRKPPQPTKKMPSPPGKMPSPPGKMPSPPGRKNLNKAGSNPPPPVPTGPPRGGNRRSRFSNAKRLTEKDRIPAAPKAPYKKPPPPPPGGGKRS